jgi:hypothetical protein
MGNRGFAAAAILAAAAAGCSSVTGAYENDAARAVQIKGGFRFEGKGIEESFKLREQAVLPMRIAVYGLDTNPCGGFEDLRVGDLDRLLEPDREDFSEVLPLPGFLAGPRTLDVDTLRQAAAVAHADVLLLYEQSTTYDESRSALAILNLLILPAWLVPTTPYTIEMDTRAALVDVRNGLVYLTLHDFRRDENHAPSALVADRARERREEVRAAAFETLAAQMREKLARLRVRSTAEAK